MSGERRTKVFSNFHPNSKTVSELKVAMETIWDSPPVQLTKLSRVKNSLTGAYVNGDEAIKMGQDWTRIPGSRLSYKEDHTEETVMAAGFEKKNYPYQTIKKCEDTFIRLDPIPTSDGQTDGRREGIAKINLRSAGIAC